MRKIVLDTFILILLLVVCCPLWAQEISRPIAVEAAGVGESERAGVIKQLFSLLKPTSGASALLLGFDTDESDDSKSYTQYYDDFTKSDKKPTNKTLMFVRGGEYSGLAAKLDYIASPQKSGWLFLGQARYFEPKPRDENEHLDKLEKEGSLKNFAFDYSRVWVTDDISKISSIKRSLIKKTKAEIDQEYRALKRGDREYHRNITDYQKIGWVSDGYYIADGYWSLIHGGAAWFEARENSGIVGLSKRRLSGNLHDWYSKKEIVERFAEHFDKSYRFGPDSKHNNVDSIWERWKGSLSGQYPDNVPTFTIERHNAQNNLKGRVLVDGNTHRSFLLETSFGSPPDKLSGYDNPKIDFSAAQAVFRNLIDVFISPNQDTAYFLTDKEIIGIDTSSGDEFYRQRHELAFNKVIMVEWAVGDHVERWRAKLGRLP